MSGKLKFHHLQYSFPGRWFGYWDIYCFRQDIYLRPDLKPGFKAVVVGAAINAAGEPVLVKELEALWGKEL